MCETGHADGCQLIDTFSVETNRVANPGRTPVTLGACDDHLTEAITDLLAANARLQHNGMPGVRAGVRDIGVTVIELANEN